MPSAFLTIAMAFAALGSPVPTEPAPERGCEILALADTKISQKDADPATLFARCGGTAVFLARAEQFQIKKRPTLGAAVALIKQDGLIHVYLVSPREDGSPLIEDYSRQLAREVGLNPDGDLSQLAIDLSEFESNGQIKASAGDRGNSSISTDEAISAERLRRKRAP